MHNFGFYALSFETNIVLCQITSGNLDSLCDIKGSISKNISFVFIDDEPDLLILLDFRDHVSIIVLPKHIGDHFNILSLDSVDYEIDLFDIALIVPVLQLGNNVDTSSDLEVVIL